MNAHTAIDLNSDLGEGIGPWPMGDDEALLRVVTSANVACGFHGGDPVIMRRTCAGAKDNGVVVGAHVSYRDLHGFGRREMDVTGPDLTGDVLYQLGALEACARVEGTEVRYVKPHGALYNRIVHDRDQAAAVVDAVRSYNADLVVMGLPGSVFLDLADEAGLATVREAFVDRAYEAGGRLVSRRQPGAVLHDPHTIAERAVHMARTGTVDAVDGTTIAPRPHSLCLHGDTPGAVAIGQRVRRALEDAGIGVTAFA